MENLSPETPADLHLSVYMHGKRDAAEKILCRLHKDPADPTNSFAHKEMRIIQAQVDMDVESSLTIRQAFKSPSLRKRFIIGWLAMSGTQFSGLLVILSISSPCPLFAMSKPNARQHINKSSTRISVSIAS